MEEGKEGSFAMNESSPRVNMHERGDCLSAQGHVTKIL